jgi:hypothetical protein
MRLLGILLVGLSILDYGLSIIGQDLYGYFGINLTGIAYTYSPIIVGLFGYFLIHKSKPDDSNDVINDLLVDGEHLVHKVTANAGTSMTSLKEPGYFFVTNKRVGFIGHSMFLQSSDGHLDFKIDFSEIESMKGGMHLEIQYDGKKIIFGVGIGKAKGIISKIEKLKN